MLHGGFWPDNPKEKYILGDLAIDGRMILLDH
jgi:hypothetical protein